MKENKISRRSFLKFGAAASAAGMLAAAPVAAHAAEADASTAADEENCLLDLFKKPKYIFLFIGDGMGTAQIQSARFYKGTVDNNGAVTEADLSFTSFPTVGSVTTYDSTSFCPDSASTATSIATGHKTESGVINMCPWTRDVPYETIAEKLHSQKGYKVGVISSVNIDHATPPENSVTFSPSPVMRKGATAGGKNNIRKFWRPGNSILPSRSSIPRSRSSRSNGTPCF